MMRKQHGEYRDMKLYPGPDGAPPALGESTILLDAEIAVALEGFKPYVTKMLQSDRNGVVRSERVVCVDIKHTPTQLRNWVYNYFSPTALDPHTQLEYVDGDYLNLTYDNLRDPARDRAEEKYRRRMMFLDHESQEYDRQAILDAPGDMYRRLTGRDGKVRVAENENSLRDYLPMNDPVVQQFTHSRSTSAGATPMSQSEMNGLADQVHLLRKQLETAKAEARRATEKLAQLSAAMQLKEPAEDPSQWEREPLTGYVGIELWRPALRREASDDVRYYATVHDRGRLVAEVGWFHILAEACRAYDAVATMVLGPDTRLNNVR